MGGGKDQKTKTASTTKLPSWYEDAAKSVISMGQNASQKGYVPWMGADVAAVDPGTIAGMQGFDAMSGAFGMPTGASASYLPEAQSFGGGVKGYSSFPAFEEAQQALKAKFPELFNYIQGFNKLGQGQSYNPTQATSFQDKLDPRFNAVANAITPANGPGSKGPGFLKEMAPKIISGMMNANQRGSEGLK